MECRAMTQCHSGSAQMDFLKGEMSHTEQRPQMQQHCQPGERNEGAVCSNSAQLGRLIRKVQSEGISWPQPDRAGRTDWKAWVSVCCKGNVLGAGRVGGEHLRLFKATVPFPGRDQTSMKGRSHPP